jgi:hypothetical protein
MNGVEQKHARHESEGLLRQVAKLYAKTSSYRDFGRATTEIRGWESVSDELVFRTDFVRSARFLFEYSREGGDGRIERHVINANENDVHVSWNALPAGSPAISLRMAMARANGASMGVACIIPTLLLVGRLGGRPITETLQVESMQPAWVDGIECHVLQGQVAFPGRVGAALDLAAEEVSARGQESAVRRIWIEQESLRIRRVVSQTKIGGLQTETTIDYQIGSTLPLPSG